MNYHDILSENDETIYDVYHGSPDPHIDQFRLHGLGHRTGTPGTLSFTTSIATAKIYGAHIYRAHVAGNFGDYLVPDDVEKAFAWRWPSHRDSIGPRYAHDKRTAGLARAAANLRTDIAKGHYALWENVAMWRDMGWDGAWCYESQSRNLIIGNIACILTIDKIT